MLFFSLFSDNATPAEKENAAVIKAMISDRKTALKAEYKDYEATYKQELRQADADYKLAQSQAKITFLSTITSSLHRELDAVEQTEEFANSDEKTKSKIYKIRLWIDQESLKCGGKQQHRPCQEEKRLEHPSPLSVLVDEKCPEGLVG
ncbi:hypothetical protein BGW38_001063 [Lunasporangiospora selenospora]|uniref:Uncharacterized protein n=1 Tax=Lunasporangiospora selenospora TaxID=979761 RepID=A0A9P6G261_9FUNG|nr:hypothetical protein BGW38_001063 [Lunasporangiospora selenospora]